MKQIFTYILDRAVAAFACWAEFGGQYMVPGFKSNSDYSGLGATRYVAVMATAAFQANLATATLSSAILGVMQNAPKVGEAMQIAKFGPSKWVAGGAIAANAILTTNASGRATTVVSGGIGMGRALEAAGADGDIISTDLFFPVRWGNV